MEENIKILEDLAETLNKTCENGICEASMSIEKLIKGYRELEEELERQREINIIINKQNLNDNYERALEKTMTKFLNENIENDYIPKSKVKELHKEYYEKAFAKPYDCTTADYKHSQAMGGWRALNKLLMEDK